VWGSPGLGGLILVVVRSVQGLSNSTDDKMISMISIDRSSDDDDDIKNMWKVYAI
jgi:hypothetical protein